MRTLIAQRAEAQVIAHAAHRCRVAVATKSSDEGVKYGGNYDNRKSHTKTSVFTGTKSVPALQI